HSSNVISSLLEFDDSGDGRGKTVPVGRLFFELLPPEPGQRIKFAATVVFTQLPLGSNPTALFQLVQRGVERAIADPQYIAGHLFQTLTNGPAIERIQGQYFQDQHVQCPLKQLRRLTQASLLSVTE